MFPDTCSITLPAAPSPWHGFFLSLAILSVSMFKSVVLCYSGGLYHHLPVKGLFQKGRSAKRLTLSSETLSKPGLRVGSINSELIQLPSDPTKSWFSAEM